MGLLSSGIVVLIYERKTQPDLEISLDPKRTLGFFGGKVPFEFYHVIIRNKPPGRFFPTRKPAWACHAILDVLDSSGRVLIKDVQARWTSQPEPLIPALQGNTISNLLDPARIVQSRKVDIHVHEDQHLPVLLKYEGDSKCYIFSNESYPYTLWKRPDWEISLGEFKIRITVFYERGPRVFVLGLTNSGTSRDDIKFIIDTA